MSIRKKSATTWVRIYANGDYNSSEDLIATADGLEIECDTLSWEEIDSARAALGGPDVMPASNQNEAFQLACLRRDRSNLARCYLELHKALQKIERFGHSNGHGCGYTCANIAKAALAISR